MIKKTIGKAKPPLQIWSQGFSKSIQDFLKVAKTLAPSWKKEGLDNLRLGAAVFACIEKTMIAGAPVILQERPTKKNLRARPHIVGVMVITTSLHDPATKKSLPAGAYLVKFRPKGKGRFDFDFINSKSRVQLSAEASFLDPTGWDDDKPELINFVVHVEWDGKANATACVSFLGWEKCWPLDFAPDGDLGPMDPGWEGWDAENPGSF